MTTAYEDKCEDLVAEVCFDIAHARQLLNYLEDQLDHPLQDDWDDALSWADERVRDAITLLRNAYRSLEGKEV